MWRDQLTSRQSLKAGRSLASRPSTKVLHSRVLEQVYSKDKAPPWTPMMRVCYIYVPFHALPKCQIPSTGRARASVGGPVAVSPSCLAGASQNAVQLASPSRPLINSDRSLYIRHS